MAGAPWLSDPDDRAGWVTSSFSTGSGECVEVRHGSAAIGVRDSKNRAGGAIGVPQPAWASFLASVR